MFSRIFDVKTALRYISNPNLKEEDVPEILETIRLVDIRKLANELMEFMKIKYNNFNDFARYTFKRVIITKNNGHYYVIVVCIRDTSTKYDVLVYPLEYDTIFGSMFHYIKKSHLEEFKICTMDNGNHLLSVICAQYIEHIDADILEIRIAVFESSRKIAFFLERSVNYLRHIIVMKSYDEYTIKNPNKSFYFEFTKDKRIIQFYENVTEIEAIEFIIKINGPITYKEAKPFRLCVEPYNRRSLNTCFELIKRCTIGIGSIYISESIYGRFIRHKLFFHYLRKYNYKWIKGERYESLSNNHYNGRRYCRKCRKWETIDIEYTE